MPIPVEQLRYVRLGTADLDAAADYATRVLGLQAAGREPGLAFFRSDWRDHTLVFVEGDASEQALGIELRDGAALDAAARELETAGLVVTCGNAAGNEARRVKDYIVFRSPGGLVIEMVVRPLHSGWRFFPSRDAGVVGFHGVAIRSQDVAGDQKLWTTLLSGQVSDYVGDAAFIRLDDRHHRVALHPSEQGGLLEVLFEVEGLDQIMLNAYQLPTMQIRVTHGPGRRPWSGQLFLGFEGPGPVLFGYVAEGERIGPAGRLARQFAHSRASYCSWGSDNTVPEYGGADGNQE